MIKKNYLVEKRNVLNEMRSNSMTLQEVRFLSIYLSKINARDMSTRKVVFKLEEFSKIMELGRINKRYLKSTFSGILQKVVSIPDGNGGMYAFQLFKQCHLYKEEDEWFVEIDAHDMALPLMFEFKERYFTYELWNVLKLKSNNQLRMYELLKQYEKIGKRTVKIEELKLLLGLQKEEYPVWQNFKVRVLESCKAALLECTDICFEYKTIKKGRKVSAVIFTITENEEYVNNLLLEDFLNTNEETAYLDELESLDVLDTQEEVFDFKERLYKRFQEATCYEFTMEQIEVFQAIMDSLTLETEDKRYYYLRRKYAELKERNSRIVIKDRYKYFLKMLEDHE